jgi:pimeloyl-ACP methyl ester carboxylesterase
VSDGVAVGGVFDETAPVEIPDVQYARSGDLSIAYQVMGEGPVDLVFVPFVVSTVFARYVPLVASFFERLAAFSRLILFDKRGTGASDRPRTPPTLESQMDDVRAVLDAVGSEQAALFGSGHGGQMCALFAATYPERTSALILFNTWARLPGTAEEHRNVVRLAQESVGRRETIEHGLRSHYPSVADDQSFLYWMAMAMRASTSPSAAADFNRTLVEADITDILSAIRVPTLLLYRKGPPEPDPSDVRGISFRSVEEESRRLASAIPDARAIAVPGPDRSPFVGSEVTDEVERFLRAPHEPPVPDRVLATVLFTDSPRPPSALPPLAIAAGASFWPHTVTTSDGSCIALLARNSTPQATASSRPSTAPLARSRVLMRSSPRRRYATSTSGPGFIRASASGRLGS